LKNHRVPDLIVSVGKKYIQSSIEILK
jgi:hypothetical protein